MVDSLPETFYWGFDFEKWLFLLSWQILFRFYSKTDDRVINLLLLLGYLNKNE